MSSRTAWSLAFCLVALIAACGGKPSWLPCREGARWVYDLQSETVDKATGTTDRQQGRATCTCKKAEQEGTWWLEWSTTVAGEPDQRQSQRISANDRGIVVFEMDANEPLWILPADFRKNEYRTEFWGGIVVATTVEREETMQTPAGSFPCKRVKVDSSQSQVAPATVWYAQGVGAVRISERQATSRQVSSHDLVLRELIKGEPPGK
jgi:hypothetical protein